MTGFTCRSVLPSTTILYNQCGHTYHNITHLTDNTMKIKDI